VLELRVFAALLFVEENKISFQLFLYYQSLIALLFYENEQLKIKGLVKQLYQKALQVRSYVSVALVDFSKLSEVLT
jgi:hypothetical protein